MFMKCLIHTSRTARITPDQFIINNMATFVYSEDDQGRTTWSQLRAIITRMKKKLDERYYPQGTSIGKASGGKPNQPGDTGVGRAPRPKRKTAPIINLDDDEQQQQPPKKNRRSSGRRGRGERLDKNPNKTKAALQKSDDDHAGFQDTFDVDRAPEGWQAQHSNLSKMSKEDPTKDFLRLVRDRSKHTNRSVEDAWDKDNLIKPTVGSANTRPIIDPSPYLRSFHIPRDHRSHLFVPVSHIKAMRIMLRLWGTYCELCSNRTESEDEMDIEDHWEATTVTTEYAAHSFFRRKGTELNLAGYCILEGMADPLSMPDAVLDRHQAVGMVLLESFPTMPVHEFFERIHKKFPGERMLRDEIESGDWNPIVNTALPDVDRNKRNKGVARYSPTVGLLMKTMETGTNMPLAERRAHLDVWVGMAMSSFNIDRGGNRPVFIPRTGGWSLPYHRETL